MHNSLDDTPLRIFQGMNSIPKSAKIEDCIQMKAALSYSTITTFQHYFGRLYGVSLIEEVQPPDPRLSDPLLTETGNQGAPKDLDCGVEIGRSKVDDPSDRSKHLDSWHTFCKMQLRSSFPHIIIYSSSSVCILKCALEI